MLNFDCFTVKHGTQNIQNDCHHQLSDSVRVHKNRFRPAGAPPRTTLGSLQRSPDPLAGLRGTNSKKEGMKKVGGRGKKRKVRHRPPFRKYLDPPLNSVF